MGTVTTTTISRRLALCFLLLATGACVHRDHATSPQLKVVLPLACIQGKVNNPAGVLCSMDSTTGKLKTCDFNRYRGCEVLYVEPQ